MNASKNNGRWIVIVLLLLGVALALVGLKFRRWPERKPGDAPAATRAM